METSETNERFEDTEVLSQSEISVDHVQAEPEEEESFSEENESSAQLKSETLGEDHLVFLAEKPKAQPKVIFNIIDAQYNVVKKVGRKIFKWKLSSNPNHDWDVCWTDKTVPIETFARMQPYQKINHFPGIKSIARKNNLGRNLMKMNKMFPKSYNFFPKTYLLPIDFHEFKNEFSKSTKNKTFIIKPEANSQGRGIFLTRTWENVSPKDKFVAQKYIKNPYLIDGLKFDLRIYVLLAGCDPLKIFLYEDGLGRFATEPYQRPNNQNLTSTCMHLTNYAINKDNPNFVFNNSAATDDVGHKKSLKAVFKILEDQGHDTKALWEEIKKIIIKVLCSVQPLLAHNYRSCHANEPYNNMCFEILGFDVMLDKKLKPWLIEVNHLPSFATDTPLDENIKRNLIKDALQIMNISAQDKINYKEQKKENLNQNGLSRKVKLSAEEKKFAVQKAQQERDEWESKNHGGFQKIFPLEDETEAEEDYAEFMRASGQHWQTWVGADVRKDGPKITLRQESNQEIQENEIETGKRLNLSPQHKKPSVSPKHSAGLPPKRTPSFKTLQKQEKENRKVRSSSKKKESVVIHRKESHLGPWAHDTAAEENDMNFIGQSIRGWDKDIGIIEENHNENEANLSNCKEEIHIEKPTLALLKSEERDEISAAESGLTQREYLGSSTNFVTEGNSGNHSERIPSLQKGLNNLKTLNPYGLSPKRASKKNNSNLSFKEQRSSGGSKKPSRTLSSTEEALKSPAKRTINQNRHSISGMINSGHKNTKDNLKRETPREESSYKAERPNEPTTPHKKPSSRLGSPKSEPIENVNKSLKRIVRHERSNSKNESTRREALKKINNTSDKVIQSASKDIQSIDKESKTFSRSKEASEKTKKKAIKKSKINNEENEKVSGKVTFYLSKESLNTIPHHVEQGNPKAWPLTKSSLKINDEKTPLKNQHQVLTPTVSPQYYKVSLGQDSSPLNVCETKPSSVKNEKPKKGKRSKKVPVIAESETSQFTISGPIKDRSFDSTSQDSSLFSPKIKKVQRNNFLK